VADRTEYILERYEPDVNEWWETVPYQPKSLDEAIERADALSSQNGFKYHVISERVVRKVEYETETAGEIPADNRRSL
jgi:hypothetical protein